MAATRLIALHKNKGKSVAACLKSRTDYAKNPDKTNRGELVSSYECSPLTADEEFMLSKRQYELATGRRQKNDVIAYQVRQSFKPGEVTPEEANKVGYELAMRFTKGKYPRRIFLVYIAVLRSNAPVTRIFSPRSFRVLRQAGACTKGSGIYTVRRQRKRLPGSFSPQYRRCTVQCVQGPCRFARHAPSD